MTFSAKRAVVVGITVASAFSPMMARAATVTGTVVLEGTDGKPIPGATVIAQEYDQNQFLYSSPATTDAQGAFSLSVSDASGISEIRAKYGVLLFAYAPGYGIVMSSFRPTEPIRIALAPEKVVQGTVKDASDKPVAGVPVSFSYIRTGTGNADSIGIQDKLAEYLTVKTDTAGHWEFHHIPQKAIMVNAILDDPRFVRLSTTIQTSANSKTTIIRARPGSTLTGTVTNKDGKPVAGVILSANKTNQRGVNGSFELGGNGVTDEKGAFHIERLGSGIFTLSIDATKQNNVAAPVSGIQQGEGKTTALTTPIVLTPGAIITGSVVAKGTNKPVANVSIYANTWSSATQTNASGIFELRVVPGDSIVHIGSQNEGFAYYDPSAPVTIKEGETKTLLPFELPVALQVTLQVADESGKPIAGLPVRIYHPGWMDGTRPDEYAKTDASGLWKSGSDQRTSLTLDDKDPWQVFVPNDYEVVSPATVKLTDTTPIAVVVKKVDLSSRASGRVVTPDGNPLAGANVSITSYLKDGNGNQSDYKSENITTDATGRFILSKFRPNSTITISVSKWEYKRTRSGMPESTLTISADGKQPKFTDWVLTPLTGLVNGKVLSNAGKPAPNVWVWSFDGDTRAVALTDTKGMFTLNHVPPTGPVGLFFAGGKASGSGTATERNNTLLRLPTVPNTPPGTSVLAARRKHALRLIQEQASQDTPGDGIRTADYGCDALANVVARFDVPLALSLIRQKDGEIKETQLGGVLVSATATDPEGAKPLFLQTRKKWRDGYMIFYRNFDMAMQFSTKNPAFANECYEAAKAQIGTGIPEDNFSCLLPLVQMAFRLNAPDAEQWWDRAVTAGAKETGSDTDSARTAVITFAAQGDGVRAAKHINELPKDRRESAAAEVVNAMAETQPLEAKKLLMGWIADDTLHPQSNHAGGGNYPEGFVKLTRALAPFDETGAAWVAKNTPENVRAEARVWAASAIRDPKARQIQYREVLGDERSWDKAHRFAAGIEAARRSGDPVIVTEVRTALQNAMKEDISVFDGNACENAARLTFLLGDEMTGTCRLFLEMAMRQTREYNPDSENEIWQYRTVLAAMAWIDLPRALEIANGFHDAKAVAQGKREIIRALLTSPAQWHSLLDSISN